VLRVALLALLVLAPLALGSTHELAYIPLQIVAISLGLASWARGHWRRAHGADVPLVPGQRLLLALVLLVAFQLVPLPPSLLRVLSPGSFAAFDRQALLPLDNLALSDWRTVSVNPWDTARGLVFLTTMIALYAAVFREFDDRRWQGRLAGTVVAIGFLLTIEALWQASSATPHTIYGLIKPRFDWGVYGVYVSKNHFAGYLALALPIALGFAGEALVDLGRDWRRRRRGWLALGGPAGNALVRRAAVVMVLGVGLLSARSRGGLVAGALALPVFALAIPRRRLALVLAACVPILGLFWVGPDRVASAFHGISFEHSRVELWRDAIRMFPHFPLLGAGFNAFGTAYLPFQTLSKYEWWGEAHNEYLQVLLDTGLVGSVLAGALLVRLLGGAARSAVAAGPLEAGLLASLAAMCAHNVVDFNWQIAANAATFAAVAALALRRGA